LYTLHRYIHTCCFIYCFGLYQRVVDFVIRFIPL
jgi:hypothetical protein